MSEWGSSGINEKSLGIRRSDDPEAYARAYKTAYYKKHRLPVTFLTDAQKHDRYKAHLHIQKKRRRDATAARQATTEYQRGESEKLERAAVNKKARRIAAGRRDKLNNPEKYHERRVKKVKWAKWDAFKPLYTAAQAATISTGVRWDVEHTYPISSDWVCGLHTPDNLRIATRSENLRKGSRPFGPVGSELWDSDHYSTYWPGETKTLAQKRDELLKPIRAAERARSLDAAKRLRTLRAAEESAKKVRKPPGRKPMSAEKAASMPAVQAALGGMALREVRRMFRCSVADIRRYAKMVNPDYKSPFHKHGRPQVERTIP